MSKMDAEFAVSHDKEKLVMQQSRYCMQAAEFFDRSDQVADPAYLLRHKSHVYWLKMIGRKCTN